MRSGSRVKPKLLLCELWGIGDLTLATPFLHSAAERYEIWLLAKPHAGDLLRDAFPQIQFVAWDAPWTKFRGKYRFWSWPWLNVIRTILQLRGEHFDLAVSGRRDPRDHILMWLSGAKTRIGFSTRYSRLLLSDSVKDSDPGITHRVASWRFLARTLGLPCDQEPYLRSNLAPRASRRRPLIVLHTGARIAVRRWPESYFATILTRMRERFSFDLALVPDPDGYGRSLAHFADETCERLTLSELTALLRDADLMLCNDSGPMHIAAAVGTPTIAFFGPTDPNVFGPWGKGHTIIIRDICSYRPCFDYCHFPEPFCLTRLLPDEVWPEIERAISSRLYH